jgi:putative lipoic acid-binding regulatory protein
MFKFLAPIEQLENIRELFPKAEAQTKISRKGNYISVTFTPLMYCSEYVIDTYKEAAKMDGVMAL